MHWQGWYTLAVIALVFTAMVRSLGPPDIILLGGTVLVGLAGIISAEDVVSGFANKSMLTIGALFVVAAGMREDGRAGSHRGAHNRAHEHTARRIAAHRPPGFLPVGLPEQHGRRSHGDADHQRLVSQAPHLALEDAPAARVRGHSGGHVHADRHEPQPDCQ